MTQKNLYSALIYLGVLPFLAIAVAPYFGLYEIAKIGDMSRVGALYALVIISFMAGAHWGICISQENGLSTTRTLALMVASNIYAMVPWLAYLVTGTSSVFYISVIAGFILILLSDRQLFLENIITEHYYRTRRLVTILVVICVVFTWFSYFL